MIYLSYNDLLHVAWRATGENVIVRDRGLLESAAARPQTSIFGEDAYRGLLPKTAALLHSLARNHSLVDGNKRLALGATIAFLGVNGVRLTMTNDEAYEFIVSVASGAVDDVEAIVTTLSRSSEPR